MKVLTEEAIAHLRDTFIMNADVSAFDVFINSLENSDDLLTKELKSLINKFTTSS